MRKGEDNRNTKVKVGHIDRKVKLTRGKTDIQACRQTRNKCSERGRDRERHTVRERDTHTHSEREGELKI